jgi:hypothetical protein
MRQGGVAAHEVFRANASNLVSMQVAPARRKESAMPTTAAGYLEETEFRPHVAREVVR